MSTTSTFVPPSTRVRITFVRSSSAIACGKKSDAPASTEQAKQQAAPARQYLHQTNRLRRRAASR